MQYIGFHFASSNLKKIDIFMWIKKKRFIKMQIFISTLNIYLTRSGFYTKALTNVYISFEWYSPRPEKVNVVMLQLM